VNRGLPVSSRFHPNSPGSAVAVETLETCRHPLPPRCRQRGARSWSRLTAGRGCTRRCGERWRRRCPFPALDRAGHGKDALDAASVISPECLNGQ
jgi:hypothetical protein